MAQPIIDVDAEEFELVIVEDEEPREEPSNTFDPMDQMCNLLYEASSLVPSIQEETMRLGRNGELDTSVDNMQSIRVLNIRCNQALAEARDLLKMMKDKGIWTRTAGKKQTPKIKTRVLIDEE